MTVTTKFDIGEKVHFMYHGKWRSGVISEIGIGVADEGIKIHYFFIRKGQETIIISQGNLIKK